MLKITSEHAEKLIRSTNGSIFSVSFIKKNGDLREMTCRLGVTKHLKGGEQAYDPKDYDLITVFDLQAQDYRMINIETLKRITVDGRSFSVV